jgi:hypothetical protein
MKMYDDVFVTLILKAVMVVIAPLIDRKLPESPDSTSVQMMNAATPLWSSRVDSTPMSISFIWIITTLDWNLEHPWAQCADSMDYHKIADGHHEIINCMYSRNNDGVNLFVDCPLSFRLGV